MLCLKQQELHLRVKSSLLKYDRTRDLRATTASLLVSRPDEPKEPLLPLVCLRTRMRSSSYIPKNIHIQHISLAELHKLDDQVSLGVSHCSAKLKKRQPKFSPNNGSSSGQQKKMQSHWNYIHDDLPPNLVLSKLQQSLRTFPALCYMLPPSGHAP